MPAAAVRDGDRLLLVFDTADHLDLSGFPGPLGDRLALDGSEDTDGVAVLRLRVPAEVPGRLVTSDGGWRLVFGESAVAANPPDEIRVGQAQDADGQPVLSLSVPGAAAVHWLSGPGGSRLAVVTASGRPQALSYARRYVEFGIPATLQGAAIEAKADDLAVGLGRDGAVVTRKAGLSLSGLEAGVVGSGAPPLAIARDLWQADAAGDALARYRELVSEAAVAPRSAQAEKRFRLARFMLANGLAPEAASVLGLARREDGIFGKRREVVLLAGIAAAQSGRLKEARTLLSSEVLADDREAALWRAVLDGRERAWDKALAGFKRAAAVLDRYPEDLAGQLRLGAMRAALATGDLAAAEFQVASIDRLPAGSVSRDDHDLARALLDEAAGRTEAAVKAFRRLSEGAARPVEAEATLRLVANETRAGRMPADAAIARLEVLAMSWRGDRIELGTLVELARLYSAGGRWREAIATARRADAYFPLYDETRRLHDDTAARFEALLLGEEGSKLSAVQILALYYDFREFAPIGRRGDEIVRRLSDRLVELDLLDQAADLLQHQVDKRLTGTARAAVAARLAAIRLIAGKPALALAALQSTRLAELPGGLRRYRLLVEAQAQAEIGRTDLALELLEGESRPEFARSRASLLFNAGRWGPAGEESERLAGTSWQRPGPLTDGMRKSVMRAAIAYGLANDRMAADRLRSKFAAKMADSPDARAFDLLARPDAVRLPEFRLIVRELGRKDSLRELLADDATASFEPEERAERPDGSRPG